MKIRKIVLTEDGPKIDINVSDNELFFHTHNFISSGGILIRANYVNNIFFSKNIKNKIRKVQKTGFSLNRNYKIDLGEPGNDFIAPDFQSVISVMSKRENSPIIDLKLTMQTERLRLMGLKIRILSIPHKKQVIEIDEKYAKLLDFPDSFITANTDAVIVSHPEEMIAIIMVLMPGEEIEVFKNNFFF